MSGSALGSWAYTKSGAHQTAKLAESIGCPVYDSQYLVHCLRKRPLNQILKAEVQVPFTDVAFGPIIDGVIIPADPETYLEDRKVIRPNYDLLLGVSKVEEYFSFTNKQVSGGMSADEQNEILSSYINHVTRQRKKELLAMIKNEYTDWTKTNQHPMNILNTVMEVLGDAQVIAPLIKTANINFKNNKGRHKQYVYVFSYQTRFGDYSTRIGSIHGEDLSYVFGAPLLRSGLSHFVANYSQAEASLSESVIGLWAAFARNGDPNSRSVNVRQLSRANKYNKIVWPKYDIAHQKYISINIRPRIRDHYRAHKLSMWLNLIPQLEDMPFERVVENDNSTNRVLIPWNIPPVSIRIGHPHNISKFSAADSNISSSPMPVTVMPSGEITSFSGSMDDPDYRVNMSLDAKGGHGGNSSRGDEVHYTTALTLTIIVGCSLLVLNILSFAGMYYQQRKFRRDCEMHKNSCQEKMCSNSNAKESPITPTFYHHQVQNQVLPALATIKRGSLLEGNEDMTGDWNTIYNMTTLSVKDATKFPNQEPTTVVPEEEENLLAKVSTAPSEIDYNLNTAGTQV